MKKYLYLFLTYSLLIVISPICLVAGLIDGVFAAYRAMRELFSLVHKIANE